MKTSIYSLIAGVIILMLVSSCKKENNNQLILTGELIANSECKSLKTADATRATSDTLSCIEYSFDAPNHKLSIRHINSGFNCCPESLSCTVTLTMDTIIIQEFEEIAGCNCDCLFDLDIEIDGVELKEYGIRFIEPYCGNQEKIVFVIDLTKNNEGSYCVTRKEYPWGE